MERFSEDETRRIFAEAARSSASAETHENGLSLEELQEIGRASGLDSAAVAAAAAGVRDVALDVPMWGRTPLQTRRSRVVPGVLSDDAWADAVAGLRHTFKTQGVVEQIGRQRTWTHAVGSNAEALMTRVTVEAVEGGTRITAESGGGSEKTAAVIIGGIFGTVGAFFSVIAAANDSWGAGAVIVLFLSSIALAIYAGLRFAAARRARTRPAQFDAALDDVARLVAPVSSSPETRLAALPGAELPTPEAPLRGAFLDLGDAAAPDAFDSPSRRTRA